MLLLPVIETFVLLLCSIKIHDMLELKEVYTIIDIEEEKGEPIVFVVDDICFVHVHKDRSYPT